MSEQYGLSGDEAVSFMNSSHSGLSKQEAERRLVEFGFNELIKEGKATMVAIFLDQFKNPLTIMLIFAGILSLVLNEQLEAGAIFGIVLLSVFLGFFQEYRAEKAIEALEKISAPSAKVLRDGHEHKIPARELVPGDIILIEAGDIVPADSRLLEVSNLHIEEAALTGESMASTKMISPLPLGTQITEQENMAFMGTAVTYGKGRAIVTSTGMKTEFGKIAESLQTTKKAPTPLQVKFERLARQIGIVAVALIVLVLIVGTLNGTLTFAKMVLFALVLIASTIPNALPIIVTVSLSIGTRRLAKKNMLVKRLLTAESLGAATIIVTDKTGTITKNQMTISEVLFDNKLIHVTGSGYEPTGSFRAGEKPLHPDKIELLLRIGALCNNAELTKKDSRYDIIGDPTEGALIVLGKKGNIEKAGLKEEFYFIEELPFDSDRKRMSVIYKNNINKKTEAYVKGAPDLLLKVCNRIFENGKSRKITRKDEERILRETNAFSERALRVLGLAYREVPAGKKYTIDDVEANLVFVGLVGMTDPPREEVKHAIEECREAGISVMMITGDHAITAKAVAKQIGLFKDGDMILTGEQVDKLSDEELEIEIDKVKIIARALPIQKLRIVEVLQKKGHVVAMTGDGVNDAPALKMADIGIAMGITGTDVAKEAAKATIVDDNFASIVNAIEEGRNIYDKMIKSAKYLLSCNSGEIFTVLISILLRLPLPLLPLQLLLMNLLTDNFPALGLGAESSEEGIMKRKPRNPKEHPISIGMFISIVLFGLIMGLGTLLVFIHYQESDLPKAQTMAFTTLVLFQMFAVVSSRTLHHPFRQINPFGNTWLLAGIVGSIAIQLAVIYLSPLQVIFGTVALGLMDWTFILAVSVFGFIMMEMSKIFSQHY